MSLIPIQMIFINVLAVLVLCVALYTDLRYHKIPNKLTLPAIVGGLLLSTIFSGFEGLLFSLKGLALGIGVFLIPFAMGGLGGGDVKLMGAIGALKGWSFALHAALFTALWGGVIALLAIIICRRFKVLRDFGVGLGLFIRTGGRAGAAVMLPNKDTPENERLAVPYGIAIFAGTITAYFISLPIPG